MLPYIKKAIEEQSIIQFTLFKLIVCIFAFLIVFIIGYGQSFWEKRDLQFMNNLLLEVINVQSEIQSQEFLLEDIKKDNNLTISLKNTKTNSIIRPIISGKDCTIGYYDIKLDLIIRNCNYNSTKISADQIKSMLRANNLVDKKYWASIPIYNNKELVGYVWAYAGKSDYILASFYKYNQILILVLILLAIVIFLIRKFIKQIQGCLDLFCQIIIHDNYENKNDRIVKKLPELAPILNKIRTYTDNLKKLNQELELSQIKMTKIIEGISDNFCVLDRKWNFTYVNSKLQKTAANGESSDLTDKNIWTLFPQIVNTLTYEKMQEAMKQNHSVHGEAGGLAANRDYEYHAYPYTEGLIIFFRDITELRRQQKEMGRLERLNLIGQMAAGISHEIRNPLTTVKGFLQLLSLKDRYLQEKDIMELMISEIDRANGIITNFLSLAKVNLSNRELKNINEIIDRLYPMLQADAFNNNKEVVLELDDLLPDIKFDENEIKQLILNLVRNGLEATPEKGKVLIKTFVKGERAILAISDQGTGIPEEIQDKIGTPFFTTKDTGTGLGLAISMGIAQRHGAVFKFNSSKKGTTFMIKFPLVSLDMVN